MNPNLSGPSSDSKIVVLFPRRIVTSGQAHINLVNKALPETQFPGLVRNLVADSARQSPAHTEKISGKIFILKPDANTEMGKICNQIEASLLRLLKSYPSYFNKEHEADICACWPENFRAADRWINQRDTALHRVVSTLLKSTKQVLDKGNQQDVQSRMEMEWCWANLDLLISKQYPSFMSARDFAKDLVKDCMWLAAKYYESRLPDGLRNLL